MTSVQFIDDRPDEIYDFQFARPEIPPVEPLPLKFDSNKSYRICLTLPGRWSTISGASADVVSAILNAFFAGKARVDDSAVHLDMTYSPLRHS